MSATQPARYGSPGWFIIPLGWLGSRAAEWTAALAMLPSRETRNILLVSYPRLSTSRGASALELPCFPLSSPRTPSWCPAEDITCLMVWRPCSHFCSSSQPPLGHTGHLAVEGVQRNSPLLFQLNYLSQDLALLLFVTSGWSEK